MIGPWYRVGALACGAVLAVVGPLAIYGGGVMASQDERREQRVQALVDAVRFDVPLRPVTPDEARRFQALLAKRVAPLVGMPLDEAEPLMVEIAQRTLNEVLSRNVTDSR